MPKHGAALHPLFVFIEVIQIAVVDVIDVAVMLNSRVINGCVSSDEFRRRQRLVPIALDLVLFVAARRVEPVRQVVCFRANGGDAQRAVLRHARRRMDVA